MYVCVSAFVLAWVLGGLSVFIQLWTRCDHMDAHDGAIKEMYYCIEKQSPVGKNNILEYKSYYLCYDYYHYCYYYYHYNMFIHYFYFDQENYV